MTLSRLFLGATLLVAACSSSSTTPPASSTTPATAAASSGGMVETAPPATTPAATPTETAPAATPAATPTETAPATPAATPTPAPPATAPAATASAADVTRGRAAFTRVCARCHEDGESDGPAPNRNLEEARMRTIVRQGSGRMRAIPAARLSDGDLDAVIAFLRSTHAVR